MTQIAAPVDRPRRAGVDALRKESPIQVVPAPSFRRVVRVPEPTKNEIRVRAYELYVARNGVDGSPDQDWLEAERQLREEALRKASARMTETIQ